MSDKPAVLILGGLNTCSRALATYLVPNNGEPLVSFLRIADKFSVHPATTYLGDAFTKLLENPIVHYQQANLTIPAVITKIFEPQEGQKPFLYVFDCTGDVTFDRPHEVQRDNTAKMAYSIGTEAAKRKVAAYVRLHHPFYDTSLEKHVSDEKDDPKPNGVRGLWWHEAARMLAGIQDLNLVILRCASTYGPHHLFGIVTPRITLGLVYKHLNEKMMYLWTPELRVNTVHVDDVAGSMWSLARWMEPLGRAEADKLAGETVRGFSIDSALVKDLAGYRPKGQDPIAPWFNIVDESDSNQGSMAKAISEVFGIQFGFHGAIANLWAKHDFDHMVEDINEKHMAAWAQILQKSKTLPPTPPLTAWIDGYMLAKTSVAYSGEKIKKLAGYKLARPRFTVEAIQEVIDAFKAEGSWPVPKE